MTLATGSSLSHHTMLGPLGAGAMGEVYLAAMDRRELLPDSSHPLSMQTSMFKASESGHW